MDLTLCLRETKCLVLEQPVSCKWHTFGLLSDSGCCRGLETHLVHADVPFGISRAQKISFQPTNSLKICASHEKIKKSRRTNNNTIINDYIYSKKGLILF